MRRIKSQVNKERFAPFAADKMQSFVGKNIGTIAFCADFLFVQIHCRIEVGTIELKVIVVITRLPEATTFKNERLQKTLINWSIRIIIPQMPFTKNPRLVTIVAQNFRQSYFLCSHNSATVIGVVNASGL